MSKVFDSFRRWRKSDIHKSAYAKIGSDGSLEMSELGAVVLEEAMREFAEAESFKEIYSDIEPEVPLYELEATE